MRIMLAVVLTLVLGVAVGAQEPDARDEVTVGDRDRCIWSRYDRRYEIVLEDRSGVFKGEFEVPQSIEIAPLGFIALLTLDGKRLTSLYVEDLDTVLVTVCEYLVRERDDVIKTRERREEAKSYSLDETIRKIDNGRKYVDP